MHTYIHTVHYIICWTTSPVSLSIAMLRILGKAWKLKGRRTMCTMCLRWAFSDGNYCRKAVKSASSMQLYPRRRLNPCWRPAANAVSCSRLNGVFSKNSSDTDVSVSISVQAPASSVQRCRSSLDVVGRDVAAFVDFLSATPTFLSAGYRITGLKTTF